MISKIAVRMIVIFGFIFFAANAFAVRLLTQEEALRSMFLDVDTVVAETIKFKPAVLDKIRKRLGGTMVHYRHDSESAKIDERNEITIYNGMKGGKKVGVALVNVQPGKWGPVEFIIVLDPSTAKVKDLAVMSYIEKRGRPIARRSFLRQFVGKSSRDPIALDRDIDGVSGATISSDATCFAVKCMIAMYEEAVPAGAK
jgi:Na+-translocating ferredoxin:NAD+ oxidoreductase RnfG subunit